MCSNLSILNSLGNFFIQIRIQHNIPGTLEIIINENYKNSPYVIRKNQDEYCAKLHIHVYIYILHAFMFSDIHNNKG